MKNQFQCIVIDPPYGFNDQLSMSDVKRGAMANYSTMSIEDIKTLPVKELADPTGCLLALWVPSSLLSEGLDIMTSYGFRQKQTYVWIKQKNEPFKQILNKAAKTILSDAPITKTTIKNALTDVQEACKTQLGDVLQFGLGRLFRQTHEICLIGTNNNGIYRKLMNRSQRSVSFAPNLKHSSKPETLQDALDVMFPDANKIEIFARRQRLGWKCIGNQAPATMDQDVRVSLNNLITSNQ